MEAAASSDVQQLNQECEKRARKREQNRIAQRTYRLNQKKRMQALETAVLQPSHAASTPRPATPSGSRVTGFAAPFQRRSNSTSSITASDASSSVVISGASNEPLSQHEAPPPVIADVDECQSSSNTTALHELAGFSTNRTPLQIAIQNKNVSLVKLLLENGADIAIVAVDGSTVLHLAVESGQVDIVKVILKRGVDPNERDYSGQTALFRATDSGDHAVTKLLLDSVCNPNLKDMWGNTALHHAVESNSETLVLLLLERGAHIDP